MSKRKASAKTDGALIERLGIDAKLWAEEFCAAEPVGPDIDTVRTWFASAIMAGYDRGTSDMRESIRARFPGPRLGPFDSRLSVLASQAQLLLEAQMPGHCFGELCDRLIEGANGIERIEDTYSRATTCDLIQALADQAIICLAMFREIGCDPYTVIQARLGELSSVP